MKSLVEELYKKMTGKTPSEILALGAHGSNRRYWRVNGEGGGFIAAYNEDVRENEAFYYYSRSLLQRGVHVPEVYAVSDDRRCYLQQDLGDTTLYMHLLDKQRNGGGFDAEMLSLYKRVLDDLAAMQTLGRDMDFS